MKRRIAAGVFLVVLVAGSLAVAANWIEVKIADVPPEMTNALARFGAGTNTRYFRVDAPPPKSLWRVEIRDGEEFKKLLVSATEKVVDGKTNFQLVRIDHGPSQ